MDNSKVIEVLTANGIEFTTNGDEIIAYTKKGRFVYITACACAYGTTTGWTMKTRGMYVTFNCSCVSALEFASSYISKSIVEFINGLPDLP